MIAPGPDVRLDAVAALRGEMLRRAQDRPGVPAPRIEALGIVNILDDSIAAGHPDRSAATMHLATDVLVVGPMRMVGNARRPCGTCLALRWQRLRPEFQRQGLELGQRSQARGSWPEVTGYLADAAWHLYLHVLATPVVPLSVTERLGDGKSIAQTSVYAMDLSSLLVRRFVLTAEPMCPHCSGSGTEPVFATLPPTPKQSADNYRGRQMHNFDLPTDALVNPLCGVLGTTTFPTITSPTTAPVTGRVVIRGHYGMAEMTFSGQDDSFRGSRDLALFEGLERYAGIARKYRDEPVVARFADVADHALDPRECGLYSDLTYQLDDACNPFDPDKSIAWVRGTRLSTGEPILVPRRLVYYGGDTQDDDFVFDSSNGCATGSSLAEAILFGLLELIERDAFVLGWYGGAHLTEIDVSGTHDTQLLMMLDRAALQGYDVHFFDNRIDLPVPAVTGLAVRRDGGLGLLSFAAGAGMDSAAAVRSAAGEILTYLPELPKRVGERLGDLRAMMNDYYLVRQLRDHPALFALPEMARFTARYLRPRRVMAFDEVYRDWERTRPTTLDLRDDVAFLQAQLSEAGLDVIVVEQTSPEQRALGLHTVATIVPGMLPLDFGWARQRALHMPRMFSAYRRAGWRDDDLAVSDLHRIPHPFP